MTVETGYSVALIMTQHPIEAVSRVPAQIPRPALYRVEVHRYTTDDRGHVHTDQVVVGTDIPATEAREMQRNAEATFNKAYKKPPKPIIEPDPEPMEDEPAPVKAIPARPRGRPKAK